MITSKVYRSPHGPDDGDTPLHRAVKDKNVNISRIECILRRGYRPDDVNCNFFAPLHYAVTHPKADPRIVRMLVDYGANVNIRRYGVGVTPLHLLLKMDFVNMEVMSELIRCGANLNAKDVNSKGMLPLHLAIENKNCDLNIIRKLIKSGANVNEKMHYGGLTPLHLASFHCRLDVVQVLLQHGAQVDAKDSIGQTPLKYCLFNYFIEPNMDTVINIVRELVEYGANVNVRNGRSITLLMEYICGDHHYERYLDVTKKLLDLGADVNAVDTNGRNILSYCLQRRDLDPLMIKELLERDVDIKTKDCDGYTTLHYLTNRYQHDKHINTQVCFKLMIAHTILCSERCLLPTICRHKELGEHMYACHSELDRMKSIEILNGVSLHTILTSKSISAHSSSKEESRSGLGKLLSYLFHKTFANYSYRILSVLRSERKLFKHSGTAFLEQISQF